MNPAKSLRLRCKQALKMKMAHVVRFKIIREAFSQMRLILAVRVTNARHLIGFDRKTDEYKQSRYMQLCHPIHIARAIKPSHRKELVQACCLMLTALMGKRMAHRTLTQPYRQSPARRQQGARYPLPSSLPPQSFSKRPLPRANSILLQTFLSQIRLHHPRL